MYMNTMAAAATSTSTTNYRNKLYNGCCLLLLFLLFCCFACMTTSYRYEGPEMICGEDNVNHTRASTWCQYSNPFSSQLQLLFPGSMPDFTAIPKGYWCEPSSGSGGGGGGAGNGQGDLCQNIVSMRTYDDRDTDTRYVIIASRNNTIYMTTYSKEAPVLSEFKVPNSHSSHVIGMELANAPNNYLVQQYDWVTKKYRVLFLLVQLDSLDLLVWWSKEFDEEVIQYKVLPPTPSLFLPPIVILSKGALQFYLGRSTTFSLSCELTIKNANDLLGFETIYQLGRFDDWQKKHAIQYPMRIPDAAFKGEDNILKKRLLVFLYDSTQVRMVNYGDMDTWTDTEWCTTAIDFADRTSQNSMSSLLWVADEHMDPTLDFKSSPSITAVKVYASPLRHPQLPSDEEPITCSNVTFAPSQQIYLSVALGHTVNGSRENATVLTMHIDELANVDFNKIDELCKDTPKPHLKRDCFFNPALRPSDYVFHNCKNCARNEITLDNDRVDAIDMKFIDVPAMVNGSWAYNPSGRLNPFIICETARTYSENLYLRCVKNVTQLYSNDTRKQCDALIFNLPPDILQPFFETSWQDNLFALGHDTFMRIEQSFVNHEGVEDKLPIPQPSSISVVGQTMNISPGTPFGDFKQTKVNKMKALGRVIDLHVSDNGQHAYASQ